MRSKRAIARELILDTAVDRPPLWDLALADDDVRAALEALLREGHVLLYDTVRPASALAVGDALARIADDRNWASSDNLPGYNLVLTESGGAEYRSSAAA